MSNFIRHLKDIVCPCCSEATNLAHLQHVFEGYRDHVLRGVADDASPYPERSCRAAAWGHGVLLAKDDLDEPTEWPLCKECAYGSFLTCGDGRTWRICRNATLTPLKSSDVCPNFDER